MSLRWALVPVTAVALSCGGASSRDAGSPGTGAELRDHPPVLVNSETPVEYPLEMYDRKVEADVVLRLFVDAQGVLHADSTRIAESSGFPLLDSAALAAVPRFRFAPGFKRGTATAMSFLQPVHFRHPEGASAAGER